VPAVKWLNRTLAVFLALGTLAVALAAFVLWLLGSEAGTSLVFDRLLARAGSAITVGRTSGSFLGGFVLEDVRLRLSRDELDIDRLALSWNASAALLGSLAFALVGPNVSVSSPTVRLNDSTVASSSRTSNGSSRTSERSGAASVAGNRR
jgi:hypothetical protein